MEPLQVRPIGPPRDGVRVLALSGELDYATERTFVVMACQALAEGCRRLIVECSGLTFCDSEGLGGLLDVRLAAEQRDVLLVLAAISSPLRHVLALTDVLQVFVVADTVEQALRVAGTAAGFGGPEL
ncbi:STAS domain-containing protein [Streptomyces sp. NPDC006733]|uniref:STAS domain-containing protein n=1 Tax=Streptomyces sp. NPDC006733 TaxID=3155460 RepID=UPI0033C16D7E